MAFRRDYEDELLGVLLAGAREGQRRPRPMDCVDLAVNALRMRLQPAASPSARVASGLPTLVYVGALLELAAAITVLATISNVQADLTGHDGGVSDDQWRAVVAGQLEAVALAACLAAAGWLGLGWAIRRGHGWARVAFAIFLGVNLFSLFDGLVHGSFSFAPAAVAVGVALCLVQLVAAVRIFSPWSGTIGGLRVVAGRIAWPRLG